MAPVWLSRMTYTGDLGYEIWMAAGVPALPVRPAVGGRPAEYDMRLFGFRALITMRLEKNFGTWFREYRPIYTPLEAGMDRVPQVRSRLHRSCRPSKPRSPAAARSASW